MNRHLSPVIEKMAKQSLDLLEKYFRLEVEGLEHVPARGAALFIANHSGFMGLDAALLNHQLQKHLGRKPVTMTHYLWFLSSISASMMEHFGYIEASTENAMKALKRHRQVILFPEGEKGNFKPSSKAYRLQEFKRGFVRIALMSQVPMIPTLILGAEEANLNLKMFQFSKIWPGGVLPLPLNLLPFPVRWKIRFLPPIQLPFEPSAANDVELVHELTEEIRGSMQKSLNDELQKRGVPF